MNKTIVKRSNIQRKYSAFMSKTQYKAEIDLFINTIKNNVINNDKEIQAIQICSQSDSIIYLFIDILNKSFKSNFEKEFLKNFVIANSTYFGINFKNSEDIVKISDDLSQIQLYQFIPQNRILYKYGDKTNYFYVLLKGLIGFLIPKDKKVKIKLKDYFKYLNTLIKSDEKQILTQCLLKNKHLLTFTEYKLSDYMRELSRIVEPLTKDEEFLLEVEMTSKAFSERKNSSYLRSVNSLSEIENIKLEIGLFLKRHKDNNKEYSKDNKNTNKVSNSSLEADYYKDAPSVTVQDYLDIFNFTEYLVSKKEEEDYFDETESNPIIQATLYYFEVEKYLNSFDKFGYTSIDNISEERLATAITLEDTHVSIILKNNYCRMVKETDLKNKRVYLSRLSKIEVFSTVTFPALRSYCDFIIEHNCPIGHRVFDENLPSDNVYFIEKGQFRVTMRRNLNELEKILKFYNQEMELERLKKDLKTGLKRYKFDKFSKEKRLITIYTATDMDVIGIEEGVCDDNYLYSLECISITGTIFSLKRELFKKLYVEEPDVEEMTNNVIKKKTEHLIQKIKDIRSSLLNTFNDLWNETPVQFINSLKQMTVYKDKPKKTPVKITQMYNTVKGFNFKNNYKDYKDYKELKELTKSNDLLLNSSNLSAEIVNKFDNIDNIERLDKYDNLNGSNFSGSFQVRQMKNEQLDIVNNNHNPSHNHDNDHNPYNKNEHNPINEAKNEIQLTDKADKALAIIKESITSTNNLVSLDKMEFNKININNKSLDNLFENEMNEDEYRNFNNKMLKEELNYNVRRKKVISETENLLGGIINDNINNEQLFKNNICFDDYIKLNDFNVVDFLPSENVFKISNNINSNNNKGNQKYTSNINHINNSNIGNTNNPNSSKLVLPMLNNNNTTKHSIDRSKHIDFNLQRNKSCDFLTNKKRSIYNYKIPKLMKLKSNNGIIDGANKSNGNNSPISTALSSVNKIKTEKAYVSLMELENKLLVEKNIRNKNNKDSKYSNEYNDEKKIMKHKAKEMKLEKTKHNGFRYVTKV